MNFDWAAKNPNSLIYVIYPSEIMFETLLHAIKIRATSRKEARL